jgi:hypothetical protein
MDIAYRIIPGDVKGNFVAQPDLVRGNFGSFAA